MQIRNEDLFIYINPNQLCWFILVAYSLDRDSFPQRSVFSACNSFASLSNALCTRLGLQEFISVFFLKNVIV